MNNNVSEKNSRFPICGGKRPFSIVRKVIAGLVFAILFALVFAILVKLLWNGIMPDIFDVKAISFWQAFGIILLAKLIFGGAGSRYHYYHPRDHRYFYRWIRNGYDFGDDKLNKMSHRKKWGYYKQYWRDEGKAAFEAYVDKIETD